MNSLIKYNGNYLNNPNDVELLYVKSHSHKDNVIFDGPYDREQLDDIKSSAITVKDNISVCIMGNGAVKNEEINEALKKEFGEGYFELILKYAYQKRKIYDVIKVYENAKNDFIQVIMGIDILLGCKLYNFTEDEIKDEPPEALRINDDVNIAPTIKWIQYGDSNYSIPCEPRNDNQHSLNEFKITLEKGLKNINAIINAYQCNESTPTLDNTKIVDDFMYNLHRSSWLQQLQDYHNIPAACITSFCNNLVIHKQLPDTLKQINEYKEFIKQLTEIIRQQQTELREIPAVIINPQDTWFLSLNWCNSDINNTSIKNLIKLHGSCQDINSIVLPTQEIRDSKRLCDLKIPEISINLLNRCTTLYLWGVSLTDYDVEKHHFIFDSLRTNANISQIIVINPDKKVYDKVNNLIKIYKLEEGIGIKNYES